MIPLGELAEIIMGQSPPGETYNKEGVGLPLLNGPTEFGYIHPTPTLFTNDSRREGKEGDLIFLCERFNHWPDELGRSSLLLRERSMRNKRKHRY